MYNLLIVDDEMAIVNGLANDIDWNELGIDEVYRAYDGNQAVECLSKNRVDVILSDIRMPEMDGLKLASIVKDRWPFAKIIFMSGYDQFEYAKKAVELGVYNYILKPASDDEIITIVKKALFDMEKEFIRTSAFVVAEKQLKEAIPVLQERFLNSWIVQGKTFPEKDYNWYEAMKIPLNINEPCFLLVIRFDRRDTGSDARREEVGRIALQNLIKDILLRNHDAVFFRDGSDNLVTVVSDNLETRLRDISKYIDGMAGIFLNTVDNLLHCTVSIFWSDIIKDASLLHTSYKRIVSEMSRSLSWGSGMIRNIGSNRQETVYKGPDVLTAHPSFELLLETLQKEEAIRKIHDVFKELKSCEPVCFEVLLDVYYSISKAFVSQSMKNNTSVSSWAGIGAEYLSNFSIIKTVEELKKWSIDMIERFIGHMEGKNANQASRLIEDIKRMVLQNIYQNISISDLAASVYLNPSYLSRLFRKETGMSITDFILKQKVEKAKELLKVPGIKVYEVAGHLGYESVSHFNRVFKRETGINPKEFQTG